MSCMCELKTRDESHLKWYLQMAEWAKLKRCLARLCQIYKLYYTRPGSKIHVCCTVLSFAIACICIVKWVCLGSKQCLMF